MSSLLQSSCLSSLINPISSTKPSLFTSTTPILNPQIRPLKVSFSQSQSNAESSPSNSPNSGEGPLEVKPGSSDPDKLSFARAKEYKKTTKQEMDGNPGLGSEGNGNGGGEAQEMPVSVKIALEKAKEYTKNKGVVGDSRSEALSELTGGNAGNLANGIVEKGDDKKKQLAISSIDFVGLNFSDKKTGRGLPAGLVPVSDPFPEGDLPGVELIVGDTSKFEDATSSYPKPTEDDNSDLYKPKVSTWGVFPRPNNISKTPTEDDNSDLYKPKVSTWGVFPRPNNISKTFGGGRVIRPGEVLETADDKAAKEARTRQLLAAYKTKIGLNIDPKLKSECDQALKNGDSLMNIGKLKEALPYYEKVMDKLTFQSELHGLAALQWSICLDSLSRIANELSAHKLLTPDEKSMGITRPDEARVMYERLQTHPNALVSKKARQLIFGFQAMEMMKVTSQLPLKNTSYQNFFEAFIEDKADYSLKDNEVEVELGQALPYIIFLVSPIFIVLLIALQKRT